MHQYAIVRTKLDATYWLRINDSKDDGKWVVDRWGYEKPTSWENAPFENWNSDSENNLENNSAFIGADGTWQLVDKYHTSNYICQMPASEKNLKSPEKTRSGCKSGWENLNEKCYFISNQSLTKPEAKKFCYDMNAGLLLVSDDSENSALSQKLNSGDSFWLRINDSKGSS